MDAKETSVWVDNGRRTDVRRTSYVGVLQTVDTRSTNLTGVIHVRHMRGVEQEPQEGPHLRSSLWVEFEHVVNDVFGLG